MEAGRIPLKPEDDPVAANREWWDENATEYYEENGSVLGDDDFIWGPEGVREADLQLLGPLPRLRTAKVLEIGCGGAQCGRYLALNGVDVTASDLSPQMLERASRLNRAAGVDFPLIPADARALPFADSSFDVVFTSFGVLPFVPDLDDVNREVARVLRRGGLWVYSAMHPMRWMFPDDPTRHGMTVKNSYFAVDPYVERNDAGRLDYAEFHHTFSDHINSLASTGFTVTEVVEPRWPAGRDVVWGGWGPERSPYIPGTLIVASQRD